MNPVKKPSNNEKDKRTQRTLFMLKHAILKLLKTHKLKEISIQDISTEAMIYRTTFYTHYSDKYKLLNDCLLEKWKETLSIIDPMDQQTFEHFFLWKGIKQTLDYFKRYSNLYLQLIDEKPIILSELNPIFYTINHYLLSYLDNLQPDNTKIIISKERIADFYCSGFFNVVIHWLQKGCQERSDTLAKEFSYLTEENLKYLLGLSSISITKR